MSKRGLSMKICHFAGPRNGSKFNYSLQATFSHRELFTVECNTMQGIIPQLEEA